MKKQHFAKMATIAAIVLFTPITAQSVLASQTTAAPTAITLNKSEQPMLAYRYGCLAKDGYGAWGEGLSNSQKRACSIAMKECSMRAAPGALCYIVDRGRI